MGVLTGRFNTVKGLERSMCIYRDYSLPASSLELKATLMNSIVTLTPSSRCFEGECLFNAVKSPSKHRLLVPGAIIGLAVCETDAA